MTDPAQREKSFGKGVLETARRSLAVALVVTGLASCRSSKPPAQVPCPTPTPSPELVVFLIHGLGGDERSFGDLPEILATDYGSRLRIVPLRYSTKDRRLTVADFVPEIHAGIMSTYHDPLCPIPPSVPFAFVMHSQGGIVGLRYVERCLRRAAGCPQPAGFDGLAAPRDLRLFITFGTPFWGSPTATFLNRHPVTRRLFGSSQIKNLAFGGLTLASNRKALLLPVRRRDGAGRFFPEDTRVVNVGGDISELPSWFVRRLLRAARDFSRRLENDMVVDDTAARMDFYYHIESDPGAAAPPLTGRTSYAHEFIVLQKPHVSILSRGGLIDIRRRGARDNPSLAILEDQIEQVLGGRPPTRAADAGLHGLQVFSAEVRVYGPSALKRPLPLSEESLSLTNQSPDRIAVLRREDDALFNRSHGVNRDDAETLQVDYQTYFHQGAFAADWSTPADGRESLPEGRVGYRIEVPGFVPKTLSLTVSPTFNSYAEVFLEPMQPIPALGRWSDRSLATDGDPRLLGGLGKVLVAAWLPGDPDGGTATDHAVLAELDGSHDEEVHVESAVRSGTLPATALLVAERLREVCWVGVVGRHVGRHRGSLFAALNAPDTDPVAHLEEGTEVEVRGRFTRGTLRTDPHYAERDRYLVTGPPLDTSVGRPYAWINSVDVDILHRCAGPASPDHPAGTTSRSVSGERDAVSRPRAGAPG